MASACDGCARKSRRPHRRICGGGPCPLSWAPHEGRPGCPRVRSAAASVWHAQNRASRVKVKVGGGGQFKTASTILTLKSQRRAHRAEPPALPLMLFA